MEQRLVNTQTTNQTTLASNTISISSDYNSMKSSMARNEE